MPSKPDPAFREGNISLSWDAVEIISEGVRAGDAYGLLPGELQSDGEFSVNAGSGSVVQAVGLYRAHRAFGLQPNEADAIQIQKLFPRGPALLLLVKPLSGQEFVAAFFRSMDGSILESATSSHEFPFPRRPESPRRHSSPWLIPSAIAAGVAAALLMHCTVSQSGENPINSYSDTRETKPASARVASASTGKSPAGKIWPNRSAKAAPQNR
jgi:hypothetical protein